jgi:hypothetical protein
MRSFIQDVLYDIHAGRDSWRVITVMSTAALAITAAVLSTL